MVKNTRKVDTLFTIVNTSILIMIAIITLYPFYYVLVASVSKIRYVSSGSILWFPKGFNIAAYKSVLRSPLLPETFMNTVFITLVGTSISLVFTIIGAFVLSRRVLPGKGIFTAIIVITMLFDGGLIPFYLTVNSLNLINTRWALIIPFCGSVYNMIVMRNFFMALPTALEESATIDGCGPLKTLLFIILPLSLPSIATISLMFAVGYWNTYFYGVLFINDNKLWPLQVLLREILVEDRMKELMVEESILNTPTETMKMAMIIISTLPILCLYPFLQRYFVKGMLMGSIKG